MSSEQPTGGAVTATAPRPRPPSAGNIAGALASSSASSQGRPASMQEQALMRFLHSRRRPRRDSPELLAERAAEFRLECQNLRTASGVPRKYRPPVINLRDIPAWLPPGYRAMAGVLLGMIDRPQLMAIGGVRGTGKTALGCGLVTEFCNLWMPGRYATVAKYFEDLSSASWEQKAAARETYRRVDLLVLDEVQVRDADRQWQDNELTSLIDARYAEERATLLISNLTPDALEKNLGASVCRRLNEQGGTYAADWPPLESLLNVKEAIGA